jgi:hypothetical protein
VDTPRIGGRTRKARGKKANRTISLSNSVTRLQSRSAEDDASALPGSLKAHGKRRSGPRPKPLRGAAPILAPFSDATLKSIAPLPRCTARADDGRQARRGRPAPGRRRHTSRRLLRQNDAESRLNRANREVPVPLLLCPCYLPDTSLLSANNLPVIFLFCVRRRAAPYFDNHLKRNAFPRLTDARTRSENREKKHFIREKQGETGRMSA